MKIGIFDSGLGGLIITHSLTQALPEYDYLYLGDTARVPYGNRSAQTIYEFTRQSVEYLFAQDCGLIIIACNTASAEALRRIQRDYLPTHYPQRRVLGVLIPAAEAAVAASAGGHIGVIATTGTITSRAFDRELRKLRPTLKITRQAAPLLVPLIEDGGAQWAEQVLAQYLEPLRGVDTLILGCTHYPYLKTQFREQMGEHVTVISQDEFIPQKLTEYLGRHRELAHQLSRGGTHTFQVTDLTPQAHQLGKELYGEAIYLDLVTLPAADKP
ncbi:MAG TPA: glutamate racemase [Candidatus Saccharimonadia bacterium]|nr:glutamate racemase [Candidatus Saccharimonadia bacterium]